MDANPSFWSRSKKSLRFALECGGIDVLEKTKQ